MIDDDARRAIKVPHKITLGKSLSDRMMDKSVSLGVDVTFTVNGQRETKARYVVSDINDTTGITLLHLPR
jgi:hypothetical protein